MNPSAEIPPQAAQQMLEERFVGRRSPVATKPRVRVTANRIERLGATLIRMGKIDGDGLAAILAAQKRHGGSFGKNAVSLGLINPDDMQIALGIESGFIRADGPPQKIPPNLLAARNPYSPEAEQFRSMRTRLVTGKLSSSADLFSIVGAHESSGAPHIAANFATCLAQLGRRVLLIDADLRRPSLHQYFCKKNTLGLADILADNTPTKKTVRQTFLKSLDLVCAGAPSSDPQSLLCRLEMQKHIDYARAQYDHVVVLTAPFGATADGEFVWSMTGNALVVARRNRARLSDLKKMKAVLRDVGAELIGAVLMD